MNREPWVAAALAGAATGCRSFTGLAALALSAPSTAATEPDHTLARPAVRGVAGVLAVGEYVADKLPATPARTQLPGLLGRLVGGAACGAIIARRVAVVPPEPGPVLAAAPAPSLAPSRPDPLRVAVTAALGAAAAAGTTWAGLWWRGVAARRFGSDWPGAVVEDALALGLAAAATRMP